MKLIKTLDRWEFHRNHSERTNWHCTILYSSNTLFCPEKVCFYSQKNRKLLCFSRNILGRTCDFKQHKTVVNWAPVWREQLVACGWSQVGNFEYQRWICGCSKVQMWTSISGNRACYTNHLKKKKKKKVFFLQCTSRKYLFNGIFVTAMI